TAQAIALNAGNHTVTVTDKLGYQTTCNITVGQPNAALNATAIIVNNNNCVGCTNGSITQTISGGTSPYTYLWSNGATTKDLNSLSKGTYSVEIKDYNGCIINYTYTIVESGIALVKTGTFNDSNSDGYAQAGETISYTFSVTNTGNVPLNNVVITDPLVNIIGEPIATLAVGSTDTNTFTASYVLTQTDIDLGKVTNSALTTAKDSDQQDVTDTSGTALDNDTPTIVTLLQNPSIAIVKTNDITVGENGCASLKDGNIVTYTFSVTNKGNVSLHAVAIEDLHDGLSTIALQSGDLNNVGILDVGETWLFTATYTVTQTDVDNGQITNQASVNGTAPDTTIVTDQSGSSTTNNDPNVIPICNTASIAITKDGIYQDTNQDGIPNLGDKIVYNFVVKNTGNVTLTNVSITDQLPGLVISGGPITLAADASDSTTFTAIYPITQTDINKGFVYNLAIATGTPPSGPNDNVTATSTDPTPCLTCPVNEQCSTCTITEIQQNPSLEVIKTATVSSNNQTTDVYSFVGDIINYTIVIKNTGNVSLQNIIVKDPLTGLNTTNDSFNLSPGGYKEFYQTYTITKEDLAKDSVINIANATGQDSNGNPIPPASGTVTVEKASVLGCENIVVHNAFSPNGDGINETFVIDGIGDTTCYPENTVEIYNRWGVLVFDTTNYNNQTNAFDGFSRGRTTISKSSGLPTGTYYYILNYTSVDLGGNIQTNRKEGYLYLTR
ncbi:DUF7507 domain-containing protein, partial [Flavobacterium granuli]